MACLGVYFALTQDESIKLLSAKGDEVVRIIKEEIESRWDEEWLVQTDKAWDAIDHCLSQGNSGVLHKFVLGGKKLCDGPNYVVSYLTPDEVKAIAIAATPIAKEWFRERYFNLKKSILGINISNYEGPVTEQDFDYIWEYFQYAREFFEKAAGAGRPVVFTVDQ